MKTDNWMDMTKIDMQNIPAVSHIKKNKKVKKNVCKMQMPQMW